MVAAAAEADPGRLDPVAVDPVAVDPVAVDPAAVDPAAVDPAAVDPAAVDPAAVDPVVVDPAAVDPVVVDPVVVDPAAVDPAAVDPAVVDPAVVVAVPELAHEPIQITKQKASRYDAFGTHSRALYRQHCDVRDRHGNATASPDSRLTAETWSRKCNSREPCYAKSPTTFAARQGTKYLPSPIPRKRFHRHQFDCERTTDQASSAVSDLGAENSTTTTAIPGIFGNQMQLMVDVSRLPRIDEYQPLLPSVAGQMTTVPSGFRTVAYYLGTQTDPVTGAQVTGLMRRELDRTITDYATKTGNLTNINAQGEMLAVEVVNIEFRYFDGNQYLLQWDTESTTALPLAVEIVLWLKPPVNGRAEQAKDQMTTPYRMVVAIPTGEIPPDTTAPATTEEEPATQSSTGSSGAANSGAMGGGTAGAGGGS